MTQNKYDVLIVGGGIYGACVAWDAALRGLSVALIEKGDFGHATSANSLKIIHGGLRYLQDGNMGRVRMMARERSIWLRIAPHLVHPLTCLTPTYPKLTKSKPVMAAGLVVNDLISFDRNRYLDQYNQLPRSRVISKEDCLVAFQQPGFEGITGGALWHDAQIYNSERLLLSFVHSAAEYGANVANYVEAVSFLSDEVRIKGVRAKDILTGQVFDVQADIVVNCAGGWISSVLESMDFGLPNSKFNLSIAMNLVIPQIWSDCAFGLPSYGFPREASRQEGRRSQVLFFVPWRHFTIVGTKHLNWSKPPEEYQVAEESLQEFIAEINSAHPDLELGVEDIVHVQWGFLPTTQKGVTADNGIKLLRESKLHDHQREDGLAGLVTVEGVKYTTARITAQKVVDLVVKKLGKKAAPCQTFEKPVLGGKIESFGDFLKGEQTNTTHGLTQDVIQHLVHNYGSEYPRVFDHLQENCDWNQRVTEELPILQAEIVHAVRDEMAVKLTDIVRRRTELGAVSLPDVKSLQFCADVMANELGWSQSKKNQEIDDVISSYTNYELN